MFLLMKDVNAIETNQMTNQRMLKMMNPRMLKMMNPRMLKMMNQHQDRIHQVQDRHQDQVQDRIHQVQDRHQDQDLIRHYKTMKKMKILILIKMTNMILIKMKMTNMTLIKKTKFAKKFVNLNLLNLKK